KEVKCINTNGKQKKNRIALIGTGLMGRIHTNGYKRLGDFFPEYEYRPVLQVACARREDKVKAFAEQWGYKHYETDWRAVIARDDVDEIGRASCREGGGI